MALIADSSHPAFDTMRSEGVPVITPGEAVGSGLPHLDVGLLNLMPDAALRATDRQFARLVSAYASEADIRFRPFTVAASDRGEEARQHIAENYTTFAEVQESGLDALIVTGANPVQHDLTREVFWAGLGEVLDWARGETRSVLCSCLATHAVLERNRGLKRSKLPQKRWGVYAHDHVADHPLLAGVSEKVDAPHSHWYDMTRAEMEAVGVTVLLESSEAGVHMAVSEDGFYVFFQGHPEYDGVSLLKEYRRELGRYYRRERADYPPVPDHYFGSEARAVLDEYRPILEAARRDGTIPPRLVEDDLVADAAASWADDGQAIYRNWLSGIASADRAEPATSHIGV